MCILLISLVGIYWSSGMFVIQSLRECLQSEFFFLILSRLSFEPFGLEPVFATNANFLCRFVLMFALGAGPVPGLLLPEILPGRIRAKAMAVCLAIHWVFFFHSLWFAWAEAFTSSVDDWESNLKPQTIWTAALEQSRSFIALMLVCIMNSFVCSVDGISILSGVIHRPWILWC